jgi:hypothetical protein
LEQEGKLMVDLEVSPEYLATLSKQMDKWTTDKLAPAVGAVPVDWDDWTALKIVGGATALAGGIAIGGAIGYNWSSMMAKQFTVKGFSFTGEQAWAIVGFAKTGYSIYGKLSSGAYYEAALSTVSLIPQGINLAMMRTGVKDLLKSAGVATPILDYSDYVLTGLTYACGNSDDAGEAFTDGAKKYGDGSAALQQLMPKSEWTGAASTQYAEVVTQLRTLMGDIAKADTQMANILQAELDQLKLTRNVLGTASKIISLAIPIALALYSSPAGGPAKSKAFQIKIAASTLGVALAAVGVQVNLSFENGAKMDAHRATYEAAQKAADKLLSGSGRPKDTSGGPTIPAVGPLRTASGSGSNGPVSGGAAQSNVAGPTTSGSDSGSTSVSRLDGGEVPDGSDGLARVGAPGGGVVGGMSLAAGGGSGSRSPIASRGGESQRRSKSVEPDEARATDETGAADADADPGTQAGAGVAGAERAPVDAVAAAPEATGKGDTLGQTSTTKT